MDPLTNPLRNVYQFSRKHGQTSLYDHWKRHLEDGCSPNEHWDLEPDPSRTSPLFSATLDGNLQLAELLLQYNAALNTHNKAGRTELQEAVTRAQKDLARLFIRAGASLDAEICSEHLEGGTALHLAVAQGGVDIVTLLLQSGADPGAATRHGWTAFDIAVLDRQASLVAILLEYLDLQSIMSRAFHQLKQRPEKIDRTNEDDTSLLAYHLIEHGVHDATSHHRAAYLEILVDVAERNALKIQDDGSMATCLTHVVNVRLVDMAGSPGKITWSRDLCTQCTRFQHQDGGHAFAPFQHSTTLEELLQSAETGCTFCKLLVISMEGANPMSEYGSVFTDQFGTGDDMTVRLNVERSEKDEAGGNYRLDIVCGEKIAWHELSYVQKHVNDAVARTAPTDTESSGSTRSLAIAHAWLKRCLEEHPTCRQEAPRKMPTMVIDVGDRSSQPRLYSPQQEEKEAYVALSYCHGESHGFHTLTSNLLERTRGMHIADMPKTITDAITVTRELGLRYLWCDSLCIVQDSAESKTEQLNCMGEVYANAVLTIAAEASLSCDDGCFRKRDWALPHLTPLDLRLPNGVLAKTPWSPGLQKTTRSSDVNRVMVHAGHSLWKQEEDKISNLRTRCWALQAECLSRRILSCGEHELSWSCVTSSCSERSLAEKDARSSRWRDAIRRVLVTGFFNYGNPNLLNASTLFEHWLSLVEDYSSRRLSDPRDKLAALADVQTAIGRVLEAKPVAGVWQGHWFLPSLLWRVSTTEGRRTAFHCPSWSWASVPWPVKYSRPPHGSVNERTWGHDTNYVPEVLDLQVTSTCQADKMNGCATLRCIVFRIGRLSPKSRENLKLQTHYDDETEIDHTEDWLMPIRTAVFVPALKDRGRHYDTDSIFLLLRQVSQGTFDFKRIGLAETQSRTTKWFSEMESRTIRIF